MAEAFRWAREAHERRSLFSSDQERQTLLGWPCEPLVAWAEGKNRVEYQRSLGKKVALSWRRAPLSPAQSLARA